MKKNYIIAIVVFLLVVSFGVYSLNGKKTIQTENVKSQNTRSQKSLKDLLSLGKPQKCLLENGTIFMSDGKVRSDFSENSHMLVLNNTSYIWSDDQKSGIKTTFDIDSTPNPEAATPEAGARGTANFDFNSQNDYNCENWSEDLSIFELPKGVTFQDMSKLVNPVKPAGDSNSAQCGYCETLDGDSKTQCLKALSCN